MCWDHSATLTTYECCAWYEYQEARFTHVSNCDLCTALLHHQRESHRHQGMGNEYVAYLSIHPSEVHRLWKAVVQSEWIITVASSEDRRAWAIEQTQGNQSKRINPSFRSYGHVTAACVFVQQQWCMMYKKALFI
mmetsp:Transcript_637/g.1799  ORF Transcript_637/g.1799 Transcript_637/m.1799 type:complete len:135 (-) Transcript_637:9-413(-)